MIIRISGATGFLGSNLLHHLSGAGYNATAISRDDFRLSPKNLSKILENTDVVIHCAGRVHKRGESNHASHLQKYLDENVNLSIKLLEASLVANVKHFVFISTVSIYGSTEFIDRNTIPKPENPYALSKYICENEIIKRMSNEKKISVSIVRIPMIYGKNCPGNFKLLINFVKFGIPLPLFKKIGNRHFISLDNIKDFILCLIVKRNSRSDLKTFIICDPNPMNYCDIAKIASLKFNKEVFFVKVPDVIFKLLENNNLVMKLTRNLYIKDDLAQEELKWLPSQNNEKTVFDMLP